jgi:hypothetical protein
MGLLLEEESLKPVIFHQNTSGVKLTRIIQSLYSDSLQSLLVLSEEKIFEKVYDVRRTPSDGNSSLEPSGQVS